MNLQLFFHLDQLNFTIPSFSHFDYTSRNKDLHNKSMKTSCKLVQLPIDNYEYVQRNYSLALKYLMHCFNI